MKKKNPKTLRQWITPKLRRLSLQWPERNKALNKVKHRVEAGFFKNGKTKFKVLFACQCCGVLEDRKEVQVDHIKPIHLAKTIGQYIEMLFCLAKDLQVLCKPCHLDKTNSQSRTP